LEHDKPILISGGGIAGLTLAMLLRRNGWQPHVIERDPALRAEGYMMDFFGTGWDVAERMGLTGDIRAVRYPIERIEFVDNDSQPYIRLPIAWVRQALEDKYNYLRRSDLERILDAHARAAGVPIQYGTGIETMRENADGIDVTFNDGPQQRFALVVGADGIHSRVRELTFGPERQFSRYLGSYVAAFHFPDPDFRLDRAVKIHEETDRTAMFYPLDERRADATLLVRHDEIGHVPADERMAMVRQWFAASGWVTPRVLAAQSGVPVYFDPCTQIAMPEWSRGRVTLIGDACGCLTLLAGQGSHMAMGGAFVLATELQRHRDPAEAFKAYETIFKPLVARKQREAAFYSRYFVPRETSRPWLRRLTMSAFSRSALADYR
jgi:2-polyprenyl-6-methoxyphenol hydroxylase-like FAD-dependent oxidoreductase